MKFFIRLIPLLRLVLERLVLLPILPHQMGSRLQVFVVVVKWFFFATSFASFFGRLNPDERFIRID